MHILDEITIEEAIKAFQNLCASGERNRCVIEFCPCAACRGHPRHIVVVRGENRITGDFQILGQGLIEKVRIAFPQLGKALEFPLAILKVFASED